MKRILLAATAVLALCHPAEAKTTHRDIYLADWAFRAKHVMVQQSAAVDACNSWRKAGTSVTALRAAFSSILASPFGFYSVIGSMGRDTELSTICHNVLTGTSDKPVTL